MKNNPANQNKLKPSNSEVLIIRARTELCFLKEATQYTMKFAKLLPFL